MKLRFYLRGLGIGIVVTALIMGVAGKTTKSMTDNQIKERARELGMVEKTEQVLAENDSLKPSDERNTAGEAAKEKVIILGDDNAVSDNGLLSDDLILDNVEADSNIDKPIVESMSLPAIGTKADEAEDGQAPKMSSSSVKEEVSSSSAKEAMSSSSTKDEEGSSSVKAASSSSSVKTASSSSSVKATSSSSSVKDTSSSSSVKDTSSSSSEKPLESVVSADGKTVTIVVGSGQSSASVAKACADAGLVSDAVAFDKFLCANGYDRRISTGRKVFPVGASPVEIAGILTVR